MAKKKQTEGPRADSTEAAFLADIAQSQDGQDAELPEGEAFLDDWGIFGIYADWLADADRPEVEAIRWMIDQRKRPYKAVPGEWAWFAADKLAEGLGDPASDVPSAVFDEMLGFSKEAGSHKKYGGCDTAIVAFFAAFAQAKGKGWVPT